jgi:alkylated DNA repair dioxygenase AlkB
MDTPIIYTPNFIADPDTALKSLQTELEWERREMTPRYEYYCNDLGIPYTYGVSKFARTYEAKPYNATLLAIKAQLEVYTNTVFEVCFLNRYKDQNDHLGWHADNSPEMDDARPIAIISLGVEREIWFKYQPTNEGKCYACHGSGRHDNTDSPKCSLCDGTGKQPPALVDKVLLQHGSLCLMQPGMQDTHFHRIPKSDRLCGEHISLTFRGFVQ